MAKEQHPDWKPFLSGGRWHRTFLINGKNFRIHLPGSLQQVEAYNQFMTIEETLDDIFAEGQKYGREEFAQKMRALIGV